MLGSEDAEILSKTQFFTLTVGNTNIQAQGNKQLPCDSSNNKIK